MDGRMSSPLAPLVDRGFVRVFGQGIHDFLQRLITNDIGHVGPARAIYAALLTPQGKIQFDFFITTIDDGGFLIDISRAQLEEFIRRLNLYKLRAAVEISDASPDFLAYALWGDGPGRLGLPNAAGAQKSIAGGVAFIDPRLAALGARLLMRKSTATENVAQLRGEAATLIDYDTHRLAHGIPCSPQDFEPENSFPLESNFEELNAIDFHKGCYVGQEVTSRTKRRGTVRKRLLPVHLEGIAPPRGTAVMASGRDIGEMRSGRGHRALALLRLDKMSEAYTAGAHLVAGDSRVIPLKPEWAAFDLDDWRLGEGKAR
jgi:folate-binding protein YgfZ